MGIEVSTIVESGLCPSPDRITQDTRIQDPTCRLDDLRHVALGPQRLAVGVLYTSHSEL
jgi:hypothetical protein